MYHAYLLGGPMDGQRFKVPVVKEVVYVARYAPGPYVVINPDSCEPVTETHVYRRDDKPTRGIYWYHYQGAKQ